MFESEESDTLPQLPTLAAAANDVDAGACALALSVTRDTEPAAAPIASTPSVIPVGHAQMELSLALDALVHVLAHVPMLETQRRDVARVVLRVEALAFALARALDHFEIGP